MERTERRDYLTAINNIAKDLTDDSLKAVYEMALICRNNEKNIENPHYNQVHK